MGRLRKCLQQPHFRKILPVHLGVQRHEPIRLHQRMCAYQEVGEQPARTNRCCSPATRRIPGEPETRFRPKLLFELQVDHHPGRVQKREDRIRHYCGVSVQLRKCEWGDDQRALLSRLAQLLNNLLSSWLP